jgi:hypothetical protein
MINFFFAKINFSIKPEMFCFTFDCYHLNNAQSCTEPKHNLCYQAQAQACADLYQPASQLGHAKVTTHGW